MKPFVGFLVSAVAVLLFGSGVCGQELLVPAGTLLQCTMDEPNFSSATASVGDPVVCHLKTLEEFGKPAFPRGAMLAGHLEKAKDPGHFWGKGYLQITFDRVIMPYGDLPVPAKIIAAKGYRVDKKGDIDGKGHAKRDAVEWMIPPLWPWKVVSLPMRGPRPTLKGEEPMQLRLMDDVSVPANLAYGPMKPDKPPYATYYPSESGQTYPTGLRSQAAGNTRVAQPAADQNVAANNASSKPNAGVFQLTALVLKTNEVYQIRTYHIDGDLFRFKTVDGTDGAVDLNQIDWRKTTETTGRLRSLQPSGITARVN
jgi:hypothetical protein